MTSVTRGFIREPGRAGLLLPQLGLRALIVTHFCCSPGEQDGLGQTEEEVWAVQGGCWVGEAHMEAEFSSHMTT